MASSVLGHIDCKDKKSLSVKSRPRVTFVTSSMNLGGAERQLLLLCNELKNVATLNIISLDNHGPLLEKYRKDFPEIKTVDISKNLSINRFLKLRRLLKDSNPDLVVTWLYKADIIGGLASKLISKKAVIWSARNSDIPDLSMMKRSLLKTFSWFIPSEIVANGLPAQEFHIRLGYPTSKLTCIPNLISAWARSITSNSRLLKGIEEIDDLKIGIAARQVHGKGILESIDEISLLRDKFPRAELLIIGQKSRESEYWAQLPAYNEYEIRQLTGDAELSKWFTEIDLLLMPSTMWESQPNSLIEAIAINCPVLISNVIDLGFDIPPNLLFNPKNRGELSLLLEQIALGHQSYSKLEYQEFCSSTIKAYESKSVTEKWIKLIEKYCKENL